MNVSDSLFCCDALVLVLCFFDLPAACHVALTFVRVIITSALFTSYYSEVPSVTDRVTVVTLDWRFTTNVI